MLHTAPIRMTLLAILAMGLGVPVKAQGGPDDSVWIQLFNGTNLNDWDIKFSKHPLNENFNNTFKVVDGILTIDYSGWGNFNNEFGHMGYKVRPFSHYLLRAEYSPGTPQVAGGPGWASQNNGLMIHSQSAATMTLNQDFPISMETQLLGSGNGGSATMNLCTPGTGFHTTLTGGSVNSAHCVNASNAPPPAPGTWAWGTVLALGDSVIRHYTNPTATGTPAFTYYRPVYLSGNVGNPPANTPANGTRLTGGYILIQAETAPYRFRKIELLNLEGCMTAGNPNYKAYFVKHDAAACNATGLGSGPSWPSGFALTGNRMSTRVSGDYSLEAFDHSGKTLQSLQGAGPGVQLLEMPKAGVYLIRLRHAGYTYSRRAALL